MKIVLSFFIILIIFLSICFAGTPEQWKKRTIYQLLTDRFAGGSTCNDYNDYCGGNWKGLTEQLSYIQGMGFDAIWISPIPVNYPEGYHGYWQTDITNVNPHFGTSNDLINLVKTAHSMDIWVMLDVVANHVGPVGYDYSSIIPFNQQSYYHNCNPCPSGCSIQDFSNQPQVEWCRLANLPDLDQNNYFVNSTLLNWIHNTIQIYGFDGIRIDTTPEVPKTFWYGYVQFAGVYSIGEIFNGDVKYVSSYMSPDGPLSATLSYPLFFSLRNVFANKQTMYELQSINEEYQSYFSDLSLLGTFIDNHDNQRFLYIQNDYKLYQNAIVYTLLGEGIPIIYYGTEQGFNGGNDPENREPLWPTGFNTESELYQFIKTVINYRKKAQLWNSPQIQRYVDDNFYAFTRNDTFVALTNGGSGQNGVQVSITYHPYKNGQKLCNLFFPKSDCLVVENDSFDVYLENGECKIYYVV